MMQENNTQDVETPTGVIGKKCYWKLSKIILEYVGRRCLFFRKVVG